jgi:hypothetical protein
MPEARYVKHHSPGKGEGLFAGREFPAGRKVFEEEAVVTLGDNATPLEVYATAQVLRHMNDEQWKLFSALSHGGDLPHIDEGTEHSSKNDGSATNTRLDVWADAIEKACDADILGLPAPFADLNFRTAAEDFAKFTDNCFRIADKRKGLFLDAARLNHSCVPNCWASWNPRTETLCVHAVRNIYENEELTIAYDVDIANRHPDGAESVFFQSYNIRQARFRKRYGFHCDCEACRKKDSAKDSDFYNWIDDDYDRETIAQLAKEIENAVALNGAISSTVLSSSRQMLELKIKHGGNTWEAGKA